jgi:hypothetical protein
LKREFFGDKKDGESRTLTLGNKEFAEEQVISILREVEAARI